MGVTDYGGETWQLMIALTSDPVSDVPEESSHFVWTGQKVETEKWLFLTVSLGENRESNWTFGFDCNDSEAIVFVRQLLRDQRLMIGFPGPSRATRLPMVADNLVQKLAAVLDLYVPHWKTEFYKS